MAIKDYDEMNMLELDMIREVGSIGTGNAASALSGLLGTSVGITLPRVLILGHNEAREKLGDPEKVVVGVISQMSGDISGIMLFLFDLDYINAILKRLVGKETASYQELGELELSALTEVGNITISTYVNALSTLAGMTISLSVPAVAIDMLGGLLAVPIAQFGYETDKLLMLDGKFCMDGKEYDSNMLMMPDIQSLNSLMKKLGGEEWSGR